MPMILNNEAYQKLINEDIEWLLEQPRTLERIHIEHCLRWLRENRHIIDRCITNANN